MWMACGWLGVWVECVSVWVRECVCEIKMVVRAAESEQAAAGGGGCVVNVRLLSSLGMKSGRKIKGQKEDFSRAEISSKTSELFNYPRGKDCESRLEKN